MIQVKNLTFRYGNQADDTIKSISFSVSKGEIYGFLGPSGAGKSTTQKILTRLLSGYGGNSSVLGRELNKWGSSFYNHIGVGFELPNHYGKLTGEENLRLFADMYDNPKADLKTLLERVGLTDAAGKKVETYSKGMKMRLNFIRALIHDPEILFFDEPTSGLDPINARNIKNYILELKEMGKTIFLTTHNMYDADELCDRVAFIVNGKIMAEDVPKNLKLKYGKPSLKVEYMDNILRSREFDIENLGEDTSFEYILKNFKIISIHSREASLDEVFIKTTGQSLNLPE
jgi:fluoroquinolone transport system ATP-binding protein